jgi:hypothetical protein
MQTIETNKVDISGKVKSIIFELTGIYFRESINWNMDEVGCEKLDYLIKFFSSFIYFFPLTLIPLLNFLFYPFSALGVAILSD